MKKNIKKFLPWIILLLIIISLSSWYLLSKRITQEQQTSYSSKISEAETFLEAKQYSMAMASYYEAVDIVPSNRQAFEGIVNILILKNRTEDAVEIVEKASKALSYSDRSELYKLLGDEYYRIKEYRKAFDLYDNGLLLGVKNPELELMYAKSLINLGDIDSAKKSLEKNIYEGDSQTESVLLLSYVHSLRDLDRAKKILDTVNTYGKLEIYYEEWENVLSDLDDDEKYNASKMSRVFINNGYPYLAVKLLEPLFSDIVEYVDGLYFLGRAYYEIGDSGKAIDTLDMASTLGGFETEIFWTKARTYYLQNDLENSIKNYDLALGYMTENFVEELFGEYINILLDEEQNLKAQEVVKSIYDRYTEEPSVLLMSVSVNWILNENAKSNYYLRELEKLELDPRYEVQYLEWKIRIALDSGDDPTEYFDSFFELDRYNPVYNYLYGLYYVEVGDNDNAIQSLERALEYDLNYEISEDAMKILSSLR